MRNLGKFKGKNLLARKPMQKLFIKAEVRLITLTIALGMKLLILNYLRMTSIYCRRSTLKYKNIF